MLQPVIAKEVSKSKGRREGESASRPNAPSGGDDSRKWFQSLEYVLEYILKNQSPEQAAFFLDELVDRHLAAPVVGVETMVPTRSPSTTRLMLPSASAKTWIGR